MKRRRSRKRGQRQPRKRLSDRRPHRQLTSRFLVGPERPKPTKKPTQTSYFHELACCFRSWGLLRPTRASPDAPRTLPVRSQLYGWTRRGRLRADGRAHAGRKRLLQHPIGLSRVFRDYSRAFGRPCCGLTSSARHPCKHCLGSLLRHESRGRAVHTTANRWLPHMLEIVNM